MKYSDFQEPKPPKFPLFIDLRPDKTTDLTKTEHNNFKNVLVDKIETTDPKQQTQTAKATSESLAISQALVQTSLIQQGTKHLAHGTLANTEFIGKSQNFEGVNNPNYVNYAAAFQAGFNSSSVEDLKRRKKTTEATTTDDTTETSENDSEGLTYTHNLNLFNKLSEINPFKKNDIKNKYCRSRLQS